MDRGINPVVLAVEEEKLRGWLKLLSEIDPPEVTFSRDKLEMANEAVESCLKTVRYVREEIREVIGKCNTQSS